MTVRIVVESTGINAAVARINRLATWRADEAARAIAPILESQTRRRIESEKTSPAGAAWPANRTGTSILLRSGRNLRDSVAHRSAGADAIVEAHWRYARVHQEGMVIRPRSAGRLAFRIGDQRVFARQVRIPARPFIGLSHSNDREIVAEIDAALRALAGGPAP